MTDAARRLAEAFAQHGGTLTLYARQLDAADAEELVQEAFVRHDPPNVLAWLLTTVRHLAIDRKRSWFRRRRRERIASPTDWFDPTSADAIDARHAAELLASLPARQREIVVLRIWNGQTLASIATLIGVAESTVHAELHDALRTLRTRMEGPRCPTKT